MIYEFRTYALKPDSVTEVEKRFGEAYEPRKKFRRWPRSGTPRSARSTRSSTSGGTRTSPSAPASAPKR